MTIAAPDTSVLSRLLSELGDIVSTDPTELAGARADKSGHIAAGAPIAIVHARTIDEVQRTLRIAYETDTAVVPRGAGTGLAGGANADEGQIVLSTLGMTRIIEIADDDELAVVEPGIINSDLNAVLAERGLWWAPDPASKTISTVGGNIATNAGGLLCVKYGVTREAVIGLKVVLADGRLMRFGHRTVKGVTGLDLTALMIGSEGLLGVIVEATLRLRRIDPHPTSTIGAYFTTVEAAARAAAVVSSSGLRPAIMEVMDRTSIAAICAHLGLALREDAYLLVQTDGAAAHAEASSIMDIIQSLGGEAELSTDAQEGERLLAIRRNFHPAMLTRGTVLIEDVCVPRSALPAMFGEIEKVAAKYEIEIATVAHAGDGNLHPNFVFEPDPTQEGGVPLKVWQAAEEMFLTALRLGGTLTGEHGVGILKKRWLADEVGEDQVQLLRDIKAVFDPKGILNPGKVL